MLCKPCDHRINKVILYGLPMTYCEDCHEINGRLSFVMDYLPFRGFLYCYEGNYFSGFFGWLFLMTK